jgi:hypothetical protein
LTDGAIALALTSSVHVVRVHTGGRSRRKSSLTSLLASIVVNPFEVEGMDVPGEVAQERKADVDEEIHPASCHGPYSHGRACVTLLAVVVACEGRDLQKMVTRIRRTAEAAPIVTVILVS